MFQTKILETGDLVTVTTQSKPLINPDFWTSKSQKTHNGHQHDPVVPDEVYLTRRYLDQDGNLAIQD